MKKLLLTLAGVLASFSLFAQDDEATAAETAAGIAAMGGCMVFFLILLAINVLILIWVYRDAKSRGVDNPVLWLVLVLFTGLIGLVVYLIVRPKGEKVVCPHCGKKRMVGLGVCPNCGQA